MLTPHAPGVAPHRVCGAARGAPGPMRAPHLAAGARPAAPWPPPPSWRCRSDAAPGGGGGAGSDAGKAAMLARIAAAKKYKDGGAPPAAAAAPAAAEPRPAAPQQQPPQQQPASSDDADMDRRRREWEEELRRKEAAARGDGAYSAFMSQLEAGAVPQEEQRERGEPARPDFYSSPDAPDVLTLWENSQRAQAAARGSATQMAPWMAGVYSEDSGKLSEGLSPDMRPEEFTAAREQRVRQMGADIITSANAAAITRDTNVSQIAAAAAAAAAEAGAAAGAAAGAEAAAAGAAAGAEAEPQAAEYKPKVTTWGVFPRPQNISQAYGGGRNIKPGQELETPEQKAKREAEYAAALQRYKQQAGLTELDPETVAKAERRYAEGARMMGNGQLAEALAVFNEVRDMVPLKTRTGGLATLQAAICYDTLGNAQQAQALYKRLKGHPSGEVGRKARHLVFGFQAMDFLKTKDVSYAVDKKEYDKYFRRFADQSRVYVASEEERAADAAASRNAALLAMGVVLAPVAVFAAYALGR